MKKLNKKNKNIRFAHINSISKNKKKYDFCLINDVIHHIGIENEKLIIQILNSLMSVSKIVLIKDHFQTGFLSNNTIRLMDFWAITLMTSIQLTNIIQLKNFILC